MVKIQYLHVLYVQHLVRFARKHQLKHVCYFITTLFFYSWYRLAVCLQGAKDRVDSTVYNVKSISNLLINNGCFLFIVTKRYPLSIFRRHIITLFLMANSSDILYLAGFPKSNDEACKFSFIHSLLRLHWVYTDNLIFRHMQLHDQVSKQMQSVYDYAYLKLLI